MNYPVINPGSFELPGKARDRIVGEAAQLQQLRMELRLGRRHA